MQTGKAKKQNSKAPKNQGWHTRQGEARQSWQCRGQATRSILGTRGGGSSQPPARVSIAVRNNCRPDGRNLGEVYSIRRSSSWNIRRTRALDSYNIICSEWNVFYSWLYSPVGFLNQWFSFLGMSKLRSSGTRPWSLIMPQATWGCNDFRLLAYTIFRSAVCRYQHA